jgi:hypothetical protein
LLQVLATLSNPLVDIPSRDGDVTTGICQALDRIRENTKDGASDNPALNLDRECRKAYDLFQNEAQQLSGGGNSQDIISFFGFLREQMDRDTGVGFFSQFKFDVKNTYSYSKHAAKKAFKEAKLKVPRALEKVEPNTDSMYWLSLPTRTEDKKVMTSVKAAVTKFFKINNDAEAIIWRQGTGVTKKHITVKAKDKMSLVSCPHILCIHIKRWVATRENLIGHYDATYIRPTSQLHLPGHPNDKYTLKAIVIRPRNEEHYYCYVRVGSVWHRCNDSSTTSYGPGVSTEAFLAQRHLGTESALLFYKRSLMHGTA